MADKENINFGLLGLVGIVAIVGIVGLIMTFSPVTNSMSPDNDGNLAGDAKVSVRYAGENHATDEAGNNYNCVYRCANGDEGTAKVTNEGAGYYANCENAGKQSCGSSQVVSVSTSGNSPYFVESDIASNNFQTVRSR